MIIKITFFLLSLISLWQTKFNYFMLRCFYGSLLLTTFFLLLWQSLAKNMNQKQITNYFNKKESFNLIENEINKYENELGSQLNWNLKEVSGCRCLSKSVRGERSNSSAFAVFLPPKVKTLSTFCGLFCHFHMTSSCPPRCLSEACLS